MAKEKIEDVSDEVLRRRKRLRTVLIGVIIGVALVRISLIALDLMGPETAHFSMIL